MERLLALVANAADATVSTYDVAADRLTPLDVTPLSGKCSAFVVDPARDLVYAGVPGAVATLRLDRETGALTEVGRRDVAEPLVSLDLAGDVLLAASYHGGTGHAWPLRDGAVLAEAGRVAFPNLHCVVARDGFAYFVSLGADLVAQYAVSDAGVLTPLDPPTVALPTGSGARHLVLAPDGRNAYLVTEFSGEAFRLARDAASGTLTVAERVSIVDPDAGLAPSRFGADPRAEHLIWGADVQIAGEWLLCSERTASTIASVRIGPDGRLGEVAYLTAVPTQPRGFAVTPDGTRVVVVGERATDAALLAVEADGRLGFRDRAATGKGPNWVRFVGGTPPLAGGVHETSASASEVARIWRAAGWKVGVVTAPTTRAEALAALGEALDFPSYYGRNLDALWDCLTDLDAPTAVVWSGWSRLALRHPRDWAKVLDVLSDRAEQSPAFAVVFTAD